MRFLCGGAPDNGASGGHCRRSTVDAPEGVDAAEPMYSRHLVPPLILVKSRVPRVLDRQAAFLSRKALVITDAELRLIARAAIIGDSSQPVNGYRTPAANGMPRAL